MPRHPSFSAMRRHFLEGGDDPRSCLERHLAQIEAKESEVKAFVTLNLDGARTAADAAAARYRAGRPLSLVDGMPLGIKDVIETEDMPTSFGSPIFAGWRSGRDAAAVFALREAGAIILGKTVTTQFANREPGPTRNPRDLRRTPGGSSSGSAAAVAAGMVPAALGTQVVGSLLRPASYCGVVGFKPSYGALNRGGGMDNFSQNCIGVLAHGLDDVWAVCHTVAERAGGDPGCHALLGGPLAPPARRPTTLGFLETAGWPKADPATRAAMEQFRAWAEARGVRVVERRASSRLDTLERVTTDVAPVVQGINAWEFRWPLNTIAKRSGHLLDASMRERLAQAEGMTDRNYQSLLARRAAMRAALLDLAGEVEAFVTLASLGTAPIGIETTGDPAFNGPATAWGAPALSLPIFEVEGLPLGLQAIGFPGKDETLSAIAAWALEFAARE